MTILGCYEVDFGVLRLGNLENLTNINYGGVHIVSRLDRFYGHAKPEGDASQCVTILNGIEDLRGRGGN